MRIETRSLLITITLLLSCADQLISENRHSRIKTIRNEEQRTRPFELEYEEKFEKFSIFECRIFEKSDGQFVGFTSLSDIDPLSSHSDSVAIPDMKSLKNGGIEYLSLNSKYRNRFLYRTNISELDTVYIYDYYLNILQKIEVKKLTVTALLNIYAEKSEEGYSQYDYEIGFEIDPKYLKVNDQEMSVYNYVYIGTENPFEEGGMYPINWKKISLNEFPPIDLSTEEELHLEEKEPTDAYEFVTPEFHYYIRNFTSNSYLSRQLVVKNTKIDKIIYRKFFHDRDFVEYAPLNYSEEIGSDYIYQFAGRLFKNKPPVIFGLQFHSAGCPSIYLMDENQEEIEINCDNRH